MSLQQGMPVGSGCRFRESFDSPLAVMDQGGVIVASTVDRGISPLGASAMVTYDQTQALLINATQMTLALRFRTPAAFAGYTILSRSTTALTNNQWMLEQLAGGNVLLYVANAAADVGQYAYIPLAVSTEYVLHVVYNGGLAPGNRVLFYKNIAPIATVISGTIPATLFAGSSPLTVFQRGGGTGLAPPNDFLLREVAIYDFAMDAPTVADDYARLTNQKVVP